jgi:hypothetical protein
MEKIFSPDSPAAHPFPLYVRQFGPDESVAHRLLSQVQAWKAAGEPSSSQMSLRAYPRASDVKPGEGEILLEKQWTKLIVSWQSSV